MSHRALVEVRRNSLLQLPCWLYRGIVGLISAIDFPIKHRDCLICNQIQVSENDNRGSDTTVPPTTSGTTLGQCNVTAPLGHFSIDSDTWYDAYQVRMSLQPSTIATTHVSHPPACPLARPRAAPTQTHPTARCGATSLVRRSGLFAAMAPLPHEEDPPFSSAPPTP